MSTPRDLFETGVTVRLTAHQRNFLARKVIKGIAGARDYREHLTAKFPDVPEITRTSDSVLHSLHDLARRLGIPDDEAHP